MKPLPSAEYLRSILAYEPDTGLLTWKPRPIEHFTTRRGCSTWNSRFAGKPAFTAVSDGYHIGAVDYQTLKAHRVGWAIHFGEWPDGHLDHISGVRSDNRIANLREVDHQDNARNQKLRADNTSGVLGVSFDRRSGKWYSSIRTDGRTVPLGTFDSKETAVAARAAANEQYGFHANHGGR